MACGRWVRNVRLVLGPLILLTALALAPSRSLAEPIKATVSANTTEGYTRLIFSMSAYDEASVRQVGNVLIIGFNEPVYISVDLLAVQASGYIGAARRDPDGKSVRLALSRKVTVNAISAGEKYFVDLLPDTWKGLPPGLPQDVVEELARRAREAEKFAERERRMARPKSLAPVRVRVATQPTFTRYIFPVPDRIGVASDRAGDGLTLTFDAPLKFDLGDVEAALPPAIGAITPHSDEATSLIHFDFLGKVDVRTFRDEDGYAVDIVGASNAPQGNAQTSGQAPSPAKAEIAPPVIALPAPAGEPSIPPAALTALNPPAAKVEAAAPKALPAPAKPAVAEAQQPPAPPQANTPAVPNLEPAPRKSTNGKIPVELARQGANLKLSFPFLTPTGAAVFRRADTLWIVFDSKADLDLSALSGESSRTIRAAELTRTPDADIVRIKLDRPHLSSVAADGALWVVEIGNSTLEPTHALDLTRNLVGPNRSSLSVTLEGPRQLHRLNDPEAGDQLLVVTALPPARGFVHSQDFVEFRALASEQGVVVQPLADDVDVALAPDKVIISRPNGLTLSNSLHAALRSTALRTATFDSQVWGLDRQASYMERQSHLLAAIGAAPENKRLRPRLDLARFYIAREMYPEAKGVLDVSLAEERPAAENVSAIVLRAVAKIMMNRPADALKDLSNPIVGDQHDAPLWRSLAYARQGKWAQARAGFKSIEAAVATLPIELQRIALKDETGLQSRSVISPALKTI